MDTCCEDHRSQKAAGLDRRTIAPARSHRDIAISRYCSRNNQHNPRSIDGWSCDNPAHRSMYKACVVAKASLPLSWLDAQPPSGRCNASAAARVAALAFGLAFQRTQPPQGLTHFLQRLWLGVGPPSACQVLRFRDGLSLLRRPITSHNACASPH